MTFHLTEKIIEKIIRNVMIIINYFWYTNSSVELLFAEIIEHGDNFFHTSIINNIKTKYSVASLRKKFQRKFQDNFTCSLTKDVSDELKCQLNIAFSLTTIGYFQHIHAILFPLQEYSLVSL